MRSLFKNTSINFYKFLLLAFVSISFPLHAQRSNKKTLFPANNGPDGKAGFINYQGKTLIPFHFDAVFPFSEGFALVSQNGKYGFIDKKGKFLIEPAFEYGYSFKNGLAKLVGRDSVHYFNLEGELQFKSKGTLNFNNGLARIEKDKKYGYVNQKGQVVIEPNYYRASGFSEGLAEVREKDNMYYFFINTKGETLIETIFQPRGKFCNERCRVWINDKCGYIDKTGKLVIMNQFDYDTWYKSSFNEGVAGVKYNKKWGVIDVDGKFIIDPKHNGTIYEFHDGIARIYGKGRYGYINLKGELITDFKYEEAHDFSEGRAIAVNDSGRFELIDKSGKALKVFDYIDPDTGDTYQFNNGMCLLQYAYSAKTTKELTGNPSDRDLIIRWGGARDVYIDRDGNEVWKSSPWYVCFPASAKITLANGEEKNISDIGIGEHIKSYHHAQMENADAVVLEINEFKGQFPLIKVCVEPLSNNLLASLAQRPYVSQQTLYVTAHHPIPTCKGIKRACELEVGDMVYHQRNLKNEMEEARIVEVNKLAKKVEKVYNLKTSQPYYFVDGVLVMMK